MGYNTKSKYTTEPHTHVGRRLQAQLTIRCTLGLRVADSGALLWGVTSLVGGGEVGGGGWFLCRGRGRAEDRWPFCTRPGGGGEGEGEVAGDDDSDVEGEGDREGCLRTVFTTDEISLVNVLDFTFFLPRRDEELFLRRLLEFELGDAGNGSAPYLIFRAKTSAS